MKTSDVVPATPEGGTPRFSGAFHLATLAFRRAGQLRAGARPRVDPGRHKSCHIALLEVAAGAVSWELPAPDGRARP